MPLTSIGSLLGRTIPALAFLSRRCVDDISVKFVQETELRERGIEAITFDKLVLLLSRVWPETHHKDDYLPRFPFFEAPGLYGHGCAVEIRRGRGGNTESTFLKDYLTTFLTDLYGPFVPQDRFRFFEVKVYEPIGEMVLPSVTKAEVESWVGGAATQGRRVERGDANILDLFRSAVAPFSSRELIALGRHWSTDTTVDALQFLLGNWESRLDQTLTMLDGGSFNPDDMRWAEALTETAKYSRQMLRKTYLDFGYYSRAYESVARRQASLLRVGDAIMRQQPEADAIWNNDRVKLFRYVAPLCHSFSAYVCHSLGAPLYAHGLGPSPLPDHESPTGSQTWLSLQLGYGRSDGGTLLRPAILVPRLTLDDYKGLLDREHPVKIASSENLLKELQSSKRLPKLVRELFAEVKAHAGKARFSPP